jgi:sarcosine oxidase subunit gamma
MSDLHKAAPSQNTPLKGLKYQTEDTKTPTIMRPIKERTRLSLRMDPKDSKKAGKALGQDIPVKIGQISVASEKKALCLGPDEWLILAPENETGNILARFEEVCSATSYSLVDVSHRTVGIEIAGPNAALMLNSGCPLDLTQIAAKECTRTVLDKVQITLIHPEKNVYELEIVRSFALYVWKFLVKGGQDLGST